MRLKWTLLVTSLSGVVLAVVLMATPVAGVDPQPAVVTGLSGTLHVQQGVPCADDVDLTTPVIGGRIELTPAEGVDVVGGKRFTLTQANIAFAGFSVSRTCVLISRTRTYTEIGVQLARAITFTATSAGAGIYNVMIPKDDFLYREATIVNGDPDSGYKQPSEDVTGTIDLTAATITMHVVVATRVHFEAGPISEDRDGLLTADIAGTINFPDADSDGVPDRSDNCRFVANPGQTPVATPVISGPPNLTIASCADHDIGFPAAVDRCDANPLTITSDMPGTFAVGANLVTWRALDSRGRFATSNQTVTVVDTTSPVFTFVPLDIAVNNCGPVSLGSPSATDDCAGTPTFTNNAPASFFVGATVVTWTARDAAGNTSTATQTVTVTDTVAPTTSCIPAGVPGRGFQVMATDACASAPTIRLGSFVLANGETIQINEIGRPGIRLVNAIGPDPDPIKHFQVGKGEAVITATDGSGNVGSAICQIR